MIKKFGQYINESMNGFSKGDVVEVISIFGQVEDLPDQTAKYIGRIYIVDNYDSNAGKIETLGSGTWSVQDVRKLSPEEIKKRAPQIREILEAWEKKKASYKEASIKNINQSVKNLQQDLTHIDENMEIIEVISTDKSNYKVTLKIEKLD